MDLMQLQRVANFFGLGKVKKEPQTVRIGVLGASQVATYALVWPARKLAQADVVAVAARDGKRAQAYAKEHRIVKSYGSYEQLLADPEVDAVYVGLPNGLHGQWARKALEAGKHVLCEKPFGANAGEAREVQALARRKGLLCREAFHYREHPLAARLRELVLGPAADPTLPPWLQAPSLPGGEGGVLGPLSRLDVQLLIPQWVFGSANIRFQEQLAGGAMMDAGCYCVNMLRLLSGAEPRAVQAQATLRPNSKVLDGEMRAKVEWPALPGLQGSLHASLQDSGWFPYQEVVATGARGTLRCTGFVMPFFGHALHVKRTTTSTSSMPAAASSTQAAQAEAATPQVPRPVYNQAAPGEAGKVEEWVEYVYGPEQETTYHHQLSRFVKDLRVLKGYCTDKSLAAVQAACAGDQSDCVANQEVIDSVYTRAGLPLRLPTAQWLQEQQLLQQQQQVAVAPATPVAKQVTSFPVADGPSAL